MQDPIVNQTSNTKDLNDADMEKMMNGEIEVMPPSKSIRQTNLRWVMLVFGCVFLMGSYFCYDIPGTALGYFELPPYDLSAFQVNLMYVVYSAPNTVLPLFGGIFLDVIGIR